MKQFRLAPQQFFIFSSSQFSPKRWSNINVAQKVIWYKALSPQTHIIIHPLLLLLFPSPSTSSLSLFLTLLSTFLLLVGFTDFLWCISFDKVAILAWYPHTGWLNRELSKANGFSTETVHFWPFFDKAKMWLRSSKGKYLA